MRQLPKITDHLVAAQGPETRGPDRAQCFVQYSVTKLLCSPEKLKKDLPSTGGQLTTRSIMANGSLPPSSLDEPFLILFKHNGEQYYTGMTPKPWTLWSYWYNSTRCPPSKELSREMSYHQPTCLLETHECSWDGEPKSVSPQTGYLVWDRPLPLLGNFSWHLSHMIHNVVPEWALWRQTLSLL